MSFGYRPIYESELGNDFFAKVGELNKLRTPLYGLSAEGLRGKELTNAYDNNYTTNSYLVSRVYSFKLPKKEGEGDGYFDIRRFEQEVNNKVGKLKNKPAKFRILYLFDLFEDYIGYHRESALDYTIRSAYKSDKNNTLIALRILSESDLEFLIDFIKKKNGEYGIPINEKIIPVVSYDLLAKNYNTPEKLSEFIQNLKNRFDVPSVSFDLFSKQDKPQAGTQMIDTPVPPKYHFRYLIKETVNSIHYKDKIEELPIGVFHVRKNVRLMEDEGISGVTAHGLPIYGIDYMFPSSLSRDRVPNAPILRSKKKWVYLDKEKQTDEWIYQRIPKTDKTSEGVDNKLSNLHKEHSFVRNNKLEDKITDIRGLKLVL